MALIKCDECGAEVSDMAASCPKCGNPIHAEASSKSAPPPAGSPIAAPASKSKPSAGRKLGAAAGIFFLAVVAFMVYESESPRTPTPNTSVSASDGAAVSQAPETSAANASATTQEAAASPAPAPAAPPVIEISAPQLYEDYKANEVLADTKYKGQWLYVSGIVTEIGKDFTDDPYVNLFGENEYATVRAIFTKSAIQQLAALHQGEQISIMCRGKGRLIGDPILDCTSDDTPPRPQHTQPAAAREQSEPASTTPDTQTIETPASGAPAPAAVASASYVTSFDCSKARSDAEHLICSDPELAADDVELARIYAKAKAAATDQAAFKERIRQQWNYRERNCHDRDCVARWYADQKVALTQIAETGNVANN